MKPIQNKIVHKPIGDASKQPRALPDRKPAIGLKKPCGFCREVRIKVKDVLQYLGVKQ